MGVHSFTESKSTCRPLYDDIRKELGAGRLLVARNLVRSAPVTGRPFLLWAEAAISSRLGRIDQSEQLLRDALYDAPEFIDAKIALAKTLVGSNRWPEALSCLAQAVAQDPDNLEIALLQSWAHAQVGDFKTAADMCLALLGKDPERDGHVLVQLGHWWKALGKAAESEEAYRRATRFESAVGEAWWGLANLKSATLDRRDMSAMNEALTTCIGATGRTPLHFALAEACDRAGEFSTAFSHLERGSRLFLANDSESPARLTAQCAAALHGIDRRQFDRLSGSGCRSNEPIFVIGLPRSGTTLLEQILDCHPVVEGLGELPYLDEIARKLLSRGIDYNSALASLSPDDLKVAGERYLEAAAFHRRTQKPHFVDKMPANWVHAGLIPLIFPNARIIVANRAPLDCCFSNYRQYFPRGHAFTYSLEWLGRTHRAYSALVKDVSALTPGNFTFAEHERFLDNPDEAIASLLRDLELPFTESCLEFFNNKRAVSTPSAQQVRRPINSGGQGRWRNYRAWLHPLENALDPFVGAGLEVSQAGAE